MQTEHPRPGGETICEESEKICSAATRAEPTPRFDLISTQREKERDAPFVYRPRFSFYISPLSLSLSPTPSFSLSLALSTGGRFEKGVGEVIALPLTRVLWSRWEDTGGRRGRRAGATLSSLNAMQSLRRITRRL